MRELSEKTLGCRDYRATGPIAFVQKGRDRRDRRSRFDEAGRQADCQEPGRQRDADGRVLPDSTEAKQPKMFDEKWYPYLEAFEVKPGQKTTTLFQDSEKRKDKPPFDDLIQPSGFVIKEMPPTKGVLVVTLKAKFYEGMVLPKDFQVQNPPGGAPPAGSLPVKLRARK